MDVDVNVDDDGLNTTAVLVSVVGLVCNKRFAHPCSFLARGLLSVKPDPLACAAGC